MEPDLFKTRFEPGAAGLLGLEDARMALFNALFARSRRGGFLLRIEDTDRERSRAEYILALQEDLRWLGLDWRQGPGVDEAHGPYLQSERGHIYQQYFGTLEQHGLAYYCFCSEQVLSLSRKIQLAEGKPPRYSGRCREQSAEEVTAKFARGLQPTLRFRVPREEVVEFDDLVRGPRRFDTGEIGDFIIKRADDTPAFYFSNAVDDALMGVTHVLRGEDRLGSTPRQLLLLRALGLPAPRYGHVSPITDDAGAPLSGGHRRQSIAGLRDQGYLPEVITNYLARLGHRYDDHGFTDLDALAAGFEVEHIGQAPARHDSARLLDWQRIAVQALPEVRLWEWLGKETLGLVPEDEQGMFMATVSPHVTFPADALRWARIIYTEAQEITGPAAEVIADAGEGFFIQALGALEKHRAELKKLVLELERPGLAGESPYRPLRAAITGRLEGPDLAGLLALIGFRRARQRLEDCVKMIGSE